MHIYLLRWASLGLGIFLLFLDPSTLLFSFLYLMYMYRMLLRWDPDVCIYMCIFTFHCLGRLFVN